MRKELEWWGKEAKELKIAFDNYVKSQKDNDQSPRIIYSFVHSEDPENFIHDGAGYQMFFGKKKDIIIDLEDILTTIRASKEDFINETI